MRTEQQRDTLNFDALKLEAVTSVLDMKDLVDILSKNKAISKVYNVVQVCNRHQQLPSKIMHSLSQLIKLSF